MSELDDYRRQVCVWLEANLPRREPGAARRAARHVDAARFERARAQQRIVYEAGFFGITVPVEYGGQGLTSAHERIWNTESAGYAVPAPGGVATSVTLGIVLPTILAHGSEPQKREWVPKMLSGEEIWAQLLSEPGAGSDLAGILTRATRDGDTWVITGNKVWSSGALTADYGICLARTDWDAPKHRGLTWFKVPLHDPAVTVRPVREINGGAEFCEEFLDGVAVGADMAIGDVNGGWPIASAMLAFERAGVSAQAPSAGRPRRAAPRLPADLVALAAARGCENDAAVHQLVARAHINDSMHALLTKRVMERLKTGNADPSVASLIKLGAGIIQPLRAAIAMEIAGRAGIAWAAGDDAASEPAINFLNGRIMSIAGGSNQIQRNIISERVLGLPREPSADADKPFRDVQREARSWGTGRVR